MVTGRARMAPAKATRDLLVLDTRAVVGTASSETPARVRKRVRKVLMSSAEKITEFISPKAKKENVSDSPMAPRVTEPNLPGKRLSDCEVKHVF